ncbi:hypothetical protein M407DRAFT_20519 [Tulasnella calospora MUT 4182]|uniref:Uncharacterized protein n=1 Tax=Tulasnella calospora MUT 4182 TaxID=1051891 RepID=A0A0C3QRM1_9AGAM|nr:hypothetical protein M407DRAFT_20519 [Tulasnella calospora MUT 4182]
MTHFEMWSYLLEDSRRLATVEVLRIGVVYGFGRSWNPVPPLPDDITYTGSNPVNLIRSALQGMTNLREVYWEDVAVAPRWGIEHLDECERAFWDAMPRICRGVQVISLSLISWYRSRECWYCASLSELHRLNEIRAFRGDSLRCTHERQGLGDSPSRAIQSRLFAAFSRLESLCLRRSQILAFSNLQLPLLKDLTLINVGFEEPDGLLHLLRASPRLRSFHLEYRLGAWTIDPRPELTEIPSGSSVVPLLESFTGCWEDAQFTFNPLPDGTFRKLSQVNILRSDSNDLEERVVDIVSKALTDHKYLVGENLRYLAITTIVTAQPPNSRPTQEQDLLWTTWLSRIAVGCPRLRGLAIKAQDGRIAPEDFRDETDGWKSALSHLQELVALQLPHVIWQADVDDAGSKGAALRLAAEQCVEWLPKIRLLFTQRNLALVVSDVHEAGLIVLKKGKLLDQGQTMARTWSLYEDVREKELGHVVAELIPLRMTAGTEAWLVEDDEWS